MNTEFTEPHREAIDRVVESLWDGAVASIAEGRGIAPERVTELSGAAPLSAVQARDAGLVDTLGYRDEVYAAARARAGGDGVQLLFADRWTPRRKPTAVLRRHRDVVALVEGHGAIVSGRSKSTLQGPRMGSATVCAALRAARESDQVRAVVFRVDSPGGSAVASDTIWREVSLLRESGKPVIVSMGSLAGSGGYYVACPADVIVAQPGTITGSIGVLGGKLVVAQLLERIGLTTGTVAHGGSAQMFSARERFSDDERARLAAMLDRVYDEFVAKVAQGRRMSVEAVDSVARGRIWSGADAARNGLVDELGGLRAATALARSRAGLRTDAPLRPAVHVPALDRLRRPTSSDDPRAATVRVGWGDLGGLAATLGLAPAGPLAMPAFRLR
jgi:protease-4